MVTEYRQGFPGGAKSFQVQRKDKMLEIQKSEVDRSWEARERPEAGEDSQYRVRPWKCCVDTDFQVQPRGLQASKKMEHPENRRSRLDKGSVSWRRAGWPELMPKA